MPIKDKHKEAYAIMAYACDTCPSTELVWNSRDGVTPFSIPCNRGTCSGLKSHVNWHLDLRKRDHTPSHGQRYFVNMTMERALFLAQETLKKCGRPFDEDRVAKVASSYFGEGHNPDLQVWFTVNKVKAVSTA